MKHGRRIVLFLVLAWLPTLAYPFGLKTHIWIAQNLVAEIQSSCRVTVQDIPVKINTDVCKSIRDNPGAFMAGALGPDTYPDVITGQVTTHPGVPGDWQTADWLVHLYANAEPGPRLAFSAGYLVHAASDVFAHTYVNAYAGDIFLLTDNETAVERRHFVLEKYIDAHLPGFSHSAGSLAPPAEWLRDKLIHNGDAARNSAKSFALHVAAMNSVYVNVVELARQLDAIEHDFGKHLADITVTLADLGIQIADGEVALKTARELLSTNELRLQHEQAAFDFAESTLKRALKAIEDNKSLINHHAQEAQLARTAAESARRIEAEARQTIKNLENQIKSTQEELDRTEEKILKEVCEDKKVGRYCPPCLPYDPLCQACRDVFKRVCETIEVVNDKRRQLNNTINDLRNKLSTAEALASTAATDLAAASAKEISSLHEKVAAEALTATLEATRLGAEADFKLHRTRLDAEKRATQDAKERVDEATAQLTKLRKQLFDAEAVKRDLTKLFEQSDILSGLAHGWISGMDTAGAQFILTATRVADGMITGDSNFAESYSEWLKCYGHAYGGIPREIGQAKCQFEDFLGKIESEADAITQKLLPPPFDELHRRILDLKKQINGAVKQAASDAVLELAKLAAPDRTTADFIDLLARPEHATKEKLDEVFATSSDSAGKPLLIFGKVSELIDTDIGLDGAALNSNKFHALKDAVTLSKLALADNQAIKGLTWVLGGDPALLPDSSSSERKSILFDMVRSIDGNHQWQPYGLPYASAGGVAPRPKEPSARRYGYGPNQERPGFTLFVDPNLRSKVFLRIFSGPISGSLATHLSGYPFPECPRNPFPVSFKPDGSGSDADSGCSDGAGVSPSGSFFEWIRRAVNRLRLNPHDPF